MEQECPRAAGRIEHTLLQRARDRRRDHPRRQPVGCVIFAEIVPLVGIDQALVEALEHVDLDVAQTEAHRFPGKRTHQLTAAIGKERPVEEIGLDRPDDAFVRKQPARHHLRRIVDRKIEHARRDRLHEDGQIGVLEEKRVAADVVAINLAKQTIPQVAFQPHFWLMANLGPQPPKLRMRAAEGKAVSAKGERDRDGCRHHLRNRCEQWLKPAQQPFGVLDLDLVAADRRERAAIKRIGQQRRAVGRKADRGAAGRAPEANIGQIIGHARDDIALLASKIALQFDDGGAPRHVDPAAIVDEVALMLQLAERGAEALAQQLRDEPAQCFVPRPRSHRADDLGQPISAPTVCHFSPSPGGCTVAVARARA
jgi:hypothetical protein